MAAITDLATASSIAAGNYGVVNQSGTDKKFDLGIFAQYSSGTFTPDLRFGGVTTGISYTSRGGYYTKIADVCYVEGWITLSSKGSASGVAIIAALPFSAKNVTNLYPQAKIQWINMTSTLVEMTGVFTPNAAHFDVNGITAAAGTVGQLSDTAFANNTTLRFSGFYLTT